MAYIPELQFSQTDYFQGKAKKESKIAKDRYMTFYQQYMLQALQYCYVMFVWENLPATIDPLYFEKILHLRGKIAFIYDPDLAPKDKLTGEALDPIFAFPYTPIGMKDLQGYPDRVQLRSVNQRYSKSFYVGKKDKKICVLGRNDTVSMPTVLKIMPMVENIAELEMTRKNRLNWHKAPFIYRTTKALLSSVKQAFKSIANNERVIIQGDNFANNIGFQEINQDTPFINDKIRLEINAEWDRIMLFIGVDNTNQDKTERMIQDEVESNNEQILYSRYLMLTQRQQFADDINKAFGFEGDKQIKVRCRTQQEIIDAMGSVLGGVL